MFLTIYKVFNFYKFRQKMWWHLRSSYEKKAKQRKEIIDIVKRSLIPSIYIKEILRQCSIGSLDGLNTGIDLLAQYPNIIKYAKSFIKKDKSRWNSLRYHVNDDIIYILLRATAISKAQTQKKLNLINECAFKSTGSIREAVVLALSDIGGEDAKTMLQKMINDEDVLVRESVKEVLEDIL